MQISHFYMEVINKLKKISFSDIKSVLILLLAYVPGIIFGYKRKIWLLIDRPCSADDNSWVFFKWLKKNHPEQNSFFILDKHNCNFNKNDKRMIAYGSFRHYVYYVASNMFLDSTFTTPRPEGRFNMYLERTLKKNIKKVYLRHGIHKDGVEHHLYADHKFRLFICGAKPEYDYFVSNADYPKGFIQYTGMARFDDLLLYSTSGDFILVMPTWRRYIGCDNKKTEEENEADFLSSEYYKRYQSLIVNSRLLSFLETNNLRLRFCLHNEYRKFVHLFTSKHERVEIMTQNDSIHSLLLNMGMLVTDYSSVFFDAAYTGKPVVYYHFDYDEFRENHLSEGYFSYQNDGFGPVVNTEQELVDAVIKCFDNKTFVRDECYNQRCDVFFPLHDTKNCERIYEQIKLI